MKLKKSKLRSAHVAMLYAGGVIGYPLVAVIAEITNIENRFLSIAFRAIYLLLAAFYILAGLHKPKEWYRGKLWFAFAIFWILYLWRIIDFVFGGGDYGAYAERADDLLLFAIGASLIPSLAFARAINAEDVNRALKWSICGAALVVMGAGYLLLFSGRYQLGPQPGALTRAALESLNPISLGHLGTSLALLSIYCLLQKPLQMSVRWGLFGVALLGITAIIFSASRGPLLTFTAVLLMMGIGSIRRQGRFSMGVALRWVCVALAVGFFIVSALSYIQDEYGIQAYDRVLAILEGGKEDMAAQERRIAWQGAVEQFITHPIFGDSILEKTTGFYPHNLVLEGFMATGLIGGISLLVWILGVALCSLRLLSRGGESGWIALLSLQYLIGAMFSGGTWQQASMWGFGAASIALAQTLGQSAYSTRYHMRKLAEVSWNQ